MTTLHHSFRGVEVSLSRNRRNGKQIAEAIEKNCPKDLARLGAPEDILRKRIVFLSIQAAKRELDFFPAGFRQSFADKARQAETWSRKIEKLSKKAKYFDIDRRLHGEPQRLKSHARHLRECIRRFGRKDHDDGISVVVMNVLAVKPKFKNWEALSRVIAEAYILAGRKAGHITADKLLRSGKLYKVARIKRKVDKLTRIQRAERRRVPKNESTSSVL